MGIVCQEGGLILALKVGELFASLGLDSKKFEQKMSSAEGKFKGVEKRMGAVGKTMMTRVTAPIVGAGTAAVMTVANFDDSMSKVQAISGATGDDLDSLRGQAKELGSTTAHSASEAADAMGYLALAGWDTNQIMEATPDMLNLASAASMDLANAADIVSDTMSAFGMDADDAGEAADIFAAASSNANTSVEELGEAMKYAAPAAHAAEMDLAETSAVMGILADNGIKGSKAGTTFNAMLRDMKKNADDGQLAIDELGKEYSELSRVDLYNADGSMRDLGSVMGDVEEATKDMTTQQRDHAMSALFGEQAMKGANIMLEEGADKYNELEDATRDSEGASEEMAETMEDNIGGSFRALKSAAEGLAIEFGEVLAPTVRKVADFLAGVARRFSDMSEDQQRLIAIIAGVVAAIGPLIFIGAKLIGMFGMLAGVLGSPLLVPIAGIIAAIVGLVAIVRHLWETNLQFRKAIWVIWLSILEAGETIFEALKETFEVVFEAIKNTVISVLEYIQEFWDNWGEMILEIVKITFEQISLIITTIIEVVKNIITMFLAIIRGDWEEVWQSILNITSTIGNYIKETIGNIFKLIHAILSGIWNRMRDKAFEIWNKIRNGVVNRANSLKDSVIETVDSAMQFIRDLPSKAFEWGKQIIQGLIDGIKNMAKNIGGAIKGVAESAVSSAKGALGISSPSKEFEKIGLNVGEGLKSGIQNMQGEVENAMLKVSSPKSSGNVYNQQNQSKVFNPNVQMTLPESASPAQAQRKQKEHLKQLALEWGM